MDTSISNKSRADRLNDLYKEISNFVNEPTRALVEELISRKKITKREAVLALAKKLNQSTASIYALLEDIEEEEEEEEDNSEKLAQEWEDHDYHQLSGDDSTI